MAKKRTGMASDLRIARLAEVALMRRSGKSKEEIAEYYGLLPDTVNAWIRKLKKTWQAEAVENYGGWMLEQLGRLLEARQEAIEGWKRSIGKQQIITREAKAIANPDGGETLKPQKVIIREENSPGDPRFLVAVSQIDQQLSKLLGLEAPSKVDMRQTVEGHVEHGGIDYEQFAAAYAIFVRGKAGVAAAGTDGAGQPVDSGDDKDDRLPVDKTGIVPNGSGA